MSIISSIFNKKGKKKYMASFEQHVSGAVITSGILITPLYASSVIDLNQSLVLLALSILGGILPDMDSDNSRPIQISFRILSIFLPFLVVLSLANSNSISNILGLWIVSSIILNFIVFKLFLKITVHRGIFHSIPMGLLFGYLFIILFRNILEYEEIFSVLCGSFIFIGFIIHLLMDEFFSINVLGMSIKKSFGTALKLYAKNNLAGTGILYIIIISLIIFYPVDLGIFTKLFKSFQNIHL